jgi:hypothetical protein
VTERPIPPAWWRPKLVSAAEAAEQLAATEAFLDEIEAKRPTMDWDELVEVVDELRGELD